MYFQDSERQRDKPTSKIVEGELKMANEELVKIKNRSFPYFPERIQKRSWNTSFLLARLPTFSIPYKFLVRLTRSKHKNLLVISRNDDSFVGF